MQRMIEIKRVGPRGHVRQLLEELLGRLEHKLRHFPEDAVSVRVVFEENGSRTLSRASLTCHVPGHTIAAHEEQRDAGAAIRGVFAEVERQLEKQKARLRREHLRKRIASRRFLIAPLVAGLLASPPVAQGASEPSKPPSPQAVEAIRLLASDDLYQRQAAFLRLEALREPATASAIQRYAGDSDPDTRAYSLRALATILGAQAIPQLLQALKTDPAAEARRAALLGLEPLQAHHPDVLPAFITALRDRKTEVRMTAVDVVSRIDDPRAREAIVTRRRREQRRDVQRVLELAAQRMGL